MHYTSSCNTQSRAPEDGRDHRPKHVGLIGIINKPLLLHLVGVYIIYFTTGKRFGLFHAGKNELDVDTTIGREWASLTGYRHISGTFLLVLSAGILWAKLSNTDV